MIINKTAEIENKILDISLELKINYIIEKNISNLCKIPFSSFSEDLDVLYKNKSEAMSTVLKEYGKRIHSSEERKVFSWFQKEIYQKSKVICKKNFEANQYYKTVRCEKDITNGKFKLCTRIIPKYTIIPIDEDCISSSMNIAISRLGIFKDNISFLSLMEENEVWMSITPMEMNTMRKAIKEAKGKVLTLGCGLGYFAFMASEKKDVKDVTIVEYSDDVISLFTDYILPQFPHKKKINIVKADAFEYAESLSDGVFDYCFADIWMNGDDTQTYLKMKNTCKKFHSMKISYWMEKELLQGISRYVKFILINEYYGRNIIENYKEQQKNVLSSVGIYINDFSEVQKQDLLFQNPLLGDFVFFTNQLKNAQINTVADIEYYLKPENWL